MKTAARFVLFLVVACALCLSSSAVAAPTRYAAIAFSPSTGAYGYGNGYATKAEAIARARRECGEPDAVSKWARNAWLALAVSGDGGYGTGWGTTPAIARSMATKSCLQHNANARVILCISAYR